MKKLNIFMMLAIIMVAVSCGKGRTPEVKEAAKAASEGILGDAGEELVFLMDDYDIISSEDNDIEKKLKEKYDKLGHDASESDMKALLEEGQKMEDEQAKKETIMHSIIVGCFPKLTYPIV